jgi:hypothetical protein
MSTYSDNLWAEDMGIDLDALATEHPTHPDQIAMRRKIDRRAEAYWARERFLARVEYSSEAISATPDAEAVKTPVKRTRVRRYEFTDTQLQIALRSLNEKGGV